MWKWILLAIAVVFAVIQLVPVERPNPPVVAEVDAPSSVRTILQRSCFDCHSNQTRWPWYAHVAPVSWLVAHDVKEAREHLNFSEWDKGREGDMVERIRKEVEEGEMPLWYYLPLHPGARLTPEDVSEISSWTRR